MCFNVNKMVVGSGSEGTPKYTGGGCSIWAAFLHVFHLDTSLDVSHLVSCHVDAGSQRYMFCSYVMFTHVMTLCHDIITDVIWHVCQGL